LSFLRNGKIVSSTVYNDVLAKFSYNSIYNFSLFLVIIRARYHDVCPQADDPERCNMCTSAFFEGQVAVMDPRESWTAKWLRVDNYLPGVYAITVTGTFDKNTIEDLESRGCKYRCRP